MTKRWLYELEDGTRVYSGGMKYRPVPLEQRKYRINKPDVPGAVMHNKLWFLPLDVIPDEQRVEPETSPFKDVQYRVAKRRRKEHDAARSVP